MTTPLMNRFVKASSFVSASLLVVALAVASSAPVFSQGSGTWAATGSLNLPRTGHTATLLANGLVLVAGGEDTGGNRIANAELYNPATGTFTLTGPLSTPRIDHTATLLSNGEVLIAGGVGSTYTASSELYNPSTGKWTTSGNMTTPRAFAGAALMTNGKVLMASGSNADGSSNTTAELYDPSTGIWKATTNMPSNHTSPAILLPSGLVLVAGGGGALYNNSTAQWSATGPLYYSLVGGTAALLPNGGALVFGNKFSCYAAQFFNPATNTWAR
ncbi:MAG TPA: kelch repeat-containing protein, partial [Terracidiphilus sp.]